MTAFAMLEVVAEGESEEDDLCSEEEAEWTEAVEQQMKVDKAFAAGEPSAPASGSAAASSSGSAPAPASESAVQDDDGNVWKAGKRIGRIFIKKDRLGLPSLSAHLSCYKHPRC